MTVNDTVEYVKRKESAIINTVNKIILHQILNLVNSLNFCFVENTSVLFGLLSSLLCRLPMMALVTSHRGVRELKYLSVKDVHR